MSLWISRVKVLRFGAFQDRSLPDFQPGLNLLYGPNESGKTTLMMFLRGMFFGFEGRGRASAFIPLDGAEAGGSLALRDGQGQEWLLERWGRGRKARITVSGPAGVMSGEGACQNLIQQVNRSVYENVFAFGLDELASLESLNQQGVKELLYSASLGLGQVSLAAVEKELKEESKKLFHPDRRAKSEIRLILAELDKVRQELHRLEQQPQEYQELRQELDRVLQDIADLEGQSRQIEGELLWLKKLSQAWPVWESWHLTRAELDALPPVEGFPEDGLGRWENLKSQSDRVEEQLGELRAELAQAEAGAGAQTPDQGLLEVGSALMSLWEERVLWEERRSQQERLEKEVAARQARLTEALAQLGLGWGEDRLADFHLSLSRRYEVQNWRQRGEEARQRCRQGEEAREDCRRTLEEKEGACERARISGSASEGGWAFRWGFWILGALLALAGLGGYLGGYKQLAGILGMGGGMALLAALAILLYLSTVRRQRQQDLEEERQRAVTALDQAQAALEVSRARLAQLQEEWGAWLKEAGLPPELPPEAVLDLFSGVEKAQELLQQYREGQRVCQDLEEELADFGRRLGEILRRLARPPASREEVNATLIRLKQELGEARQAQEEKQRWLEKAASLKNDLAKWQGVGDRLREERQNLLAAAGVEGEEAFRQRAELYQRRQELGQRGRELTVQLGLVAGGEGELTRLKEDLAQTTRGDLQTQLGQAQASLGELAGQLARLREEKGKLADRRQKLERAEELSQALLREQTLATRLREAARRWTVGTLAGYFLEQGRRRFEAEYQPQVFQQAGHYFALLTKGAYLKVMTHLEGEKFFVVNRQGQHTPVERLSRGTVEQLYLALRFALIQAYSQSGRNLPLILDDILVNFDPQRARQAVRLFQEMSRSHQVLLFTCHPHLVNLVKDVLGPEAPDPIDLEAGEDQGAPLT
ncbi:MAG: AAA family ATPase [Thermodesulfobacteriota bacterium]